MVPSNHLSPILSKPYGSDNEHEEREGTPLTQPFRIASLCPSNTELLCALGLGEFIVGVDLYSDYPAEVVKTLPRLGPDLNIDIDALCALKPDLVVSSLSVPGMEHVVAAVEAVGLDQVTLSPHSVTDILDDARQLVQVLPTAIRTKINVTSLVSMMEARIDRIRDATRGVTDRPKLYFEWWPKPVFSPARDNWLTVVSELAGGQNIFADRPGSQVQDDGQAVVALQPDFFLAVWTGVPQHKVALQKIRSRQNGWETTPAFQKQQLLVLSEGLYCRPSPRLLDGLEQLLGILHPDLAADLRLQPPAAYGPVRAWDGTWWST